MSQMITIQELLNNRGLDYSKGKILLVRHKASNYDLYEADLKNHDDFLEYQKHQGENSNFLQHLIF